MRTARSLESGDRILIKIQHMWHRSTAKNMPITTAGRIRNTRDRKSKSATCSLFATINTLRNSQKPEDNRIFEKQPPTTGYPERPAILSILRNRIYLIDDFVET